jgi:outer membrane cobalamin receptor
MMISAVALAFALAQFSPSHTGELRLTVTDPAGLALQAAIVALVDEAHQVREDLTTDQRGQLTVKRLPFGTYRLTVTVPSFAPSSTLIDIRSEVPTDYRVTLTLAPLQTETTVRPDDTLLDQRQTMMVNRVGRETIATRALALPGRALADLVNTQPGWLLEANGILHPRGSEYQTQYVVDGLPLTDNRSPAFAPELDADGVQSMAILTGGYPAEYGRKLGGVIEVVTTGQARRGFHGGGSAALGSFETRSGDLLGSYSNSRTVLTLSGGGAATDRYLDPPVEENFTNHGWTAHVSAHLDQDVTDSDRFGVIVRRGDARFLVPNERVQQDAGQRQARANRETAGQFSYQHIFSANVLGDVRALVRDVAADLQSNAASTPVAAQQDRGFRELYVKASVSAHLGAHEWKAGADLDAGSVREQFAYAITDPSAFDADTPPTFAFDERRSHSEQALFVQDRIHLGAWTISAGIRWDHYALAIDDSALSPRVGVAWFWPNQNIVLRASYDRAFQTPAVENLLLASSPALDALNDHVLRLPVRPSRGDFFEAGASKALFGHLRLDVSHYRRTMDNFADDDVLLNTGVSFPIAFRRGEISGTEVKLEMPRWRSATASMAYSHMRGLGELPISGGLFLGDDAAGLVASTDRFPISQDQRHTLRGRLSYELNPSVWVAASVSYGSGLPVEFIGGAEDAIAQYGSRIIEQVDFAAGRVRPSFSSDASVGFMLHRSANRSVRVQADARNLTNRLNVINVAGLFSGTALGSPRSVAVRVRADF